MSETVQDKS